MDDTEVPGYEGTPDVTPEREGENETGSQVEPTWRLEIAVSEGTFVIDWSNHVGKNEDEEAQLRSTEEEIPGRSSEKTKANRMAKLMGRTMLAHTDYGYVSDDGFIDDSDLPDLSTEPYNENFGEYFIQTRDEILTDDGKRGKHDEDDGSVSSRKRKVECSKGEKKEYKKKKKEEKKEKKGEEKEKKKQKKCEKKEEKREKKMQKKADKVYSHVGEKVEKKERKDIDKAEKRDILKRMREEQGLDEKEAKNRWKELCSLSARDPDISKLMEKLRGEVVKVRVDKHKFPASCERLFHQICIESRKKYGILTKPIMDELTTIFKVYKPGSLKAKFQDMQRCPAKIEQLGRQCTEKRREIADFIARFPTLKPEIFYTNSMMTRSEEERREANVLESLVLEYFELKTSENKQKQLRHSCFPEEFPLFIPLTLLQIHAVASQELAILWGPDIALRCPKLREMHKIGKQKFLEEVGSTSRRTLTRHKMAQKRQDKKVAKEMEKASAGRRKRMDKEGVTKSIAALTIDESSRGNCPLLSTPQLVMRSITIVGSSVIKHFSTLCSEEESSSTATSIEGPLNFASKGQNSSDWPAEVPMAKELFFRKITKNTEKGTKGEKFYSLSTSQKAKELPDRELNPGPKRSAYLTGLYTHHYTIEECLWGIQTVSPVMFTLIDEQRSLVSDASCIITDMQSSISASRCDVHGPLNLSRMAARIRSWWHNDKDVAARRSTRASSTEETSAPSLLPITQDTKLKRHSYDLTHHLAGAEQHAIQNLVECIESKNHQGTFIFFQLLESKSIVLPSPTTASQFQEETTMFVPFSGSCLIQYDRWRQSCMDCEKCPICIKRKSRMSRFGAAGNLLGIWPNNKNKGYNGPIIQSSIFHLATERNCHKTLSFLLERLDKKSSVLANYPLDILMMKDYKGMTCPMLAVEDPDWSEHSPFTFALQEEKIGMCDVMMRSRPEECLQTGPQGESPLHLLIRKDAPESSLIRLLTYPQFLEKRHGGNLHGASPLHYACLWGDPSLLPLLLYHGADIEARDFKGRTPFLWVLLMGSGVLKHDELMTGLDAENGKNQVVTSSSPPYMKASYLAARGAKRDVRDDYGKDARDYVGSTVLSYVYDES
ncbi:linker histone H1 and H5 family protein [Planoprotostelium fungivorum]|uniref:Linker histone H1 and H5 family protein n=1 Tax=Planoprotostelium fungivorum TaxID=1890364 RepID=A0A2P6NYW3_9EUKA|nr:linker histone H1 and H5 family protein [Planoprotostelium fungivorum]